MCEDCLPLTDDPAGIPNDVILYRRVRWDQIGGRDRCPKGEEAALIGNAFSDYPASKAHEYGLGGPCMSIGISTVLEGLRLGPDAMLIGKGPDFGVAAISAGNLRSLKRKSAEPRPQGVMAAPTNDEPWHGVVFGGSQSPRNKTDKQAIADFANWVIPLVNE
jgi:hypothetical protein